MSDLSDPQDGGWIQHARPGEPSEHQRCSEKVSLDPAGRGDRKSRTQPAKRDAAGTKPLARRLTDVKIPAFPMSGRWGSTGWIPHPRSGTKPRRRAKLPGILQKLISRGRTRSAMEVSKGSMPGIHNAREGDMSPEELTQCLLDITQWMTDRAGALGSALSIPAISRKRHSVRAKLMLDCQVSSASPTIPRLVRPTQFCRASRRLLDHFPRQWLSFCATGMERCPCTNMSVLAAPRW